MQKSNKILITGSNGQLGSSIKRLTSQNKNLDLIPTDIEELDITSLSKIEQFVSIHQPSYIVNCAAYTAVDKAEEEPDKAGLINREAVKNLAQVCKQNEIRLIHVSTDYVFNGKSYLPYKEDHKVDPMGVYGKSKLAGELEIIHLDPDYLIIRTSWLYSEYGKNFVKTILKLTKEREELGVIFDQIGSPTYAGDLAKAIIQILLNPNIIKKGIYHFSDEGAISWYDFAKAIAEISGYQCDIKPIETKDYPTLAIRPHYSVLNKTKIKNDFRINIPYWKDSLKACIVNINSHKI